MFKTCEISPLSTGRGGLLTTMALCLAASWVGSTDAFAEQLQLTSFPQQSSPQQHSFAPPAIPVDCATIRYHVAEHGRAKSIAWAIKNGYSWAQISEAKRCLKG